MITLFECWNGGTVQYDGIHPPQFAFAFLAADPELVKFFQLSGRICEVLTGCEWHLNIGGQIFDVPNFPPEEINNFVLGIRSNMGYASVQIPYQLGNMFTGFITIPIALWVNTYTGRADMYNPFTGPVYGQQLLPPQMPVQWPQPQMPFPPMMPTQSQPAPPMQSANPMQPTGPMQGTNFGVTLTTQGKVEGGGAQSMLQSIATIFKGAGQISSFLSQTGVFTQSNDSGGW